VDLCSRADFVVILKVRRGLARSFAPALWRQVHEPLCLDTDRYERERQHGVGRTHPPFHLRLGHSNVATTSRYLRTTVERLRHAARLFDEARQITRRGARRLGAGENDQFFLGYFGTGTG
jgi:hypothetical protein